MGSTSVRKLFLLSNSKQHGLAYLEHCSEAVKTFLERNGVKKLLFIPYALRDHDEYANKIRKALQIYGFEVDSIHEGEDPVADIRKAEAIFIGGGNTFQLLNELYAKQLIKPIRKRILEDGVPYMGSSAGTNVATASICTTNDMPIVYPPSFTALELVPFNINPHYMDPDTSSKHMGETRDERIKQYHELDSAPPVLGIREGSWLEVTGDKASLHGDTGGKLFSRGEPAKEISPGSDLSFLLKL
jgi:dipeptidase E